MLKFQIPAKIRQVGRLYLKIKKGRRFVDLCEKIGAFGSNTRVSEICSARKSEEANNGISEVKALNLKREYYTKMSI